MTDYYLDGEEKFGPVMSILYFIGIKILPMKGIYEFVVDDIKKSGAKTVLDVGTGPGDVPIRLAKAGVQHVFGIDPSPNMIRIAWRRVRGVKHVWFKVGSSRNIPFKFKFDVICSCVSYHHWQRKAESLDYMAKFLNKNGTIRIYEFDAGTLHGIGRGVSAHALQMDKFRETLERTHLRISKIHKKGRFIAVWLKKK